MPLTPAQMSNVVGYFTSAGNANQKAAAAIGAAPVAAPVKAVAARGTTASPAVTGTVGGAGAPQWAQNLDNFANSLNPLYDAVNFKFAHTTGGKQGALGQIIGGKTADTSIAQDAAVPEGTDQAPQNGAQWILNALSTGDYAAGRFIKQIGVNNANAQAAMANPDNPANPSHPLGYLGTLAGGIGNDFAAAGRGVAEGLGARFNDQAPVTPGGDLKAMGGEQAIKGAVAGAGGDAGWQNWTAGAAGTAADVLLDPTTYIGGAGLVKGVTTGARATVDALKTGARLDDAITAGIHAGSDTTATARATAAANKLTAADKAGVAETTIPLEQELATTAAQRAADLNLPTTVDAVAADAKTAAKVPTDEPVLEDAISTPDEGPAITPKTAKTKAVLLPTDDATELAPLATTEHPAMQAVRDLLPSLTTTGRTVDAGKILSDAATPVSAAGLDPAVHAAATHVLAEAKTVPEITAGLKTLKATPAGKAFLATPLKVDGVPPTVGAALERAAMTRVTGGSVSGDAARAAVQAHLASVGAPAAKTTLESLSSAVGANVPELGAGGEPFNTPALMGALAAAKSQPARQKIVAATLNLPVAHFGSFDEAIKAATNGQVEASAMRSMLETLGIKTRATLPGTLSNMIGGKGKMAWDEIQKGVPTAQEVLDDHGITPEVMDAARTVDVPAERAGANGEAILATNQFNGSQSQLFEVAMKAGHTLELTPTDPAYVETYNKVLYNTMQQPVLKKASAIANSLFGKGQAAERSAWMYDHVVPVWDAADKALLSEGRIARLVSGDGTSFYGPLSQVLPNLNRTTVERALFGLDYRLTAAGEGYVNGVQSAEYAHGLTLYPTTIGFGAKAAREGKSVMEIAQAMIDDSGKNVFAASPEGRELLNTIAAEMDAPAFREAMVTLDTENRIAAVANAQKAATDFVNPLASDIMAGAAAGGDRSETILPIQKAAKSAAAIKVPDDSGSLVKDMAEQRLHNGAVATLGQEGTAFARSDAKALDKSESQALKDQAAHNAKPIRRTKDGVKIPKKIPAKGKVADSQRGAEGLADLRQNLDPQINADAVNLVQTGAFDDDEFGHIEATVAAESGIGFAHDMAKIEPPHPVSVALGNGAEKINELFNGGAGEGGFEGPFGLRQEYVNGPKSFNYDYGMRLAQWTSGLGQRIGQVTGQALKPEDVTGYIKSWLGALQAHGAAALTDGKKLAPDELSAALATAQPMDAARGLDKATDALPDWQIPMATELQGHIDQITPAYSRMGANPVDVAHQLANYTNTDELAIDPEATLADQQASWMHWDVSQMADPMNTLFNWHQGIMASSVEPGLAGALTHMFSHAGIENVSKAEALAKGWKPLDPERTTGLFQYVPKDALFPPELHAQIAATQRHLDQMKAVAPQGLATILRLYDRGLGVMKDSMTAWNPSHWVTNFLSDAGMNLLHGVNPADVIPAIRAMHAGNPFDIDPTTMLAAAHNSAFDDAAAAAKSAQRAFRQPVVTIRDGLGRSHGVSLSDAQVAEYAKRYGADASLHQVTDRIGDEGGGKWAKFSNSKFNPIGQINKRLNSGSVVRDNLPRYTQFISAMQSRSFRSIDEAMHYAAGQVHMAHPLPSAMSFFERTAVRRLVTFYSWQRLALGRIMELALEKPGLVTLPSKYQYEQAQAAGFDPESIGKPFGNDPRIASYESNGIFGPTFAGGYSPLGGQADLAGGTPHEWGFSISSPAMDALSSAFQGATIGSPAEMQQNLSEQIGSNISPLIAAPFEWITNSMPGGIGQGPQTEGLGKFLLDESGAPGRIAKAAGLEPKTKTVGGVAVDVNSPAQQAGENSRQALNYLTGLKFTDYTNDTSAAYAAKAATAAAASAPPAAITAQQVQSWQAAGYTPAQIAMLLGKQKTPVK